MVAGYMRLAVQDEQEAVERITTFLSGTIGWTIAQDVTNTATDRDVVFSSAGEPDVDNSFTRYIRLRGTSNGIKLYTYETFVDVGTNTGELEDADGILNVEGDNQGFFITAVADLERVVLQSQTYNDANRQAYVGRINSYYTSDQHNYPNIVKGGEDTTDTWFSPTANNAWMYGAEGSIAEYYGIQPVNSVTLEAGQESDRNGSMTLGAPILVRDDADPNLGELVGEPRGVFAGPPEVLANHIFVAFEGRVYTVFENDNVPMVVGPVTASGTEIPSF